MLGAQLQPFAFYLDLGFLSFQGGSSRIYAGGEGLDFDRAL